MEQVISPLALGAAQVTGVTIVTTKILLETWLVVVLQELLTSSVRLPKAHSPALTQLQCGGRCHRQNCQYHVLNGNTFVKMCDLVGLLS